MKKVGPQFFKNCLETNSGLSIMAFLAVFYCRSNNSNGFSCTRSQTSFCNTISKSMPDVSTGYCNWGVNQGPTLLLVLVLLALNILVWF